MESEMISPNKMPGHIEVDPAWPASQIRILAFNNNDCFEKLDVKIDEIPPLLQQWDVIWVDVIGLGSINTLLEIKDIFHLHKLALEDVTKTTQRPKAEEYKETLFTVMRRFSYDKTLESEQLSFFLGKNYVLSFQENDEDCFHTVRKRIQENQGRIRASKSDYLFYALIDAVVDSYFPIFENFGDRIEELEDEIIQIQDKDSIESIYHLRRELISLRRVIWPQREMLHSLLRESGAFISEPTQVYFRDCYNHCVQQLDLVENYRELTSSMVDIYMSMMSHRMNEVMRLLTIISTIFIPITFIAGIYGMNFNVSSSPWNMPELEWAYGYPVAMGAMLAITMGMLGYFYKKGWLSK